MKHKHHSWHREHRSLFYRRGNESPNAIPDQFDNKEEQSEHRDIEQRIDDATRRLYTLRDQLSNADYNNVARTWDQFVNEWYRGREDKEDLLSSIESVLTQYEGTVQRMSLTKRIQVEQEKTGEFWVQLPNDPHFYFADEKTCYRYERNSKNFQIRIDETFIDIKGLTIPGASKPLQNGDYDDYNTVYQWGKQNDAHDLIDLTPAATALNLDEKLVDATPKQQVRRKNRKNQNTIKTTIERSETVKRGVNTIQPDTTILREQEPGDPQVTRIENQPLSPSKKTLPRLAVNLEDQTWENDIIPGNHPMNLYGGPAGKYREFIKLYRQYGDAIDPLRDIWNRVHAGKKYDVEGYPLEFYENLLVQLRQFREFAKKQESWPNPEEANAKLTSGIRTIRDSNDSPQTKISNLMLLQIEVYPGRMGVYGQDPEYFYRAATDPKKAFYFHPLIRDAIIAIGGAIFTQGKKSIH